MLPFRAPHKKKALKIIVSAVALVLSLILWARAYQEAFDLYRTPSQIHNTSPVQRIRLGGHIVSGSIKYEPSHRVTFMLTDDKTAIPVEYIGVPPSLFQEGVQAIALGDFDGCKFVAKELFVKHDQNYRIKKDALCS